MEKSTEITDADLLSYLEARLKIATDHVTFYEGVIDNNDYLVREVKMLRAIKDRFAKSIAPLKVCTGCGWRSDKPLPKTALACCPDNNYVSIDDYLNNSQYKNMRNESGFLPCRHHFIQKDTYWKSCTHCGMLAPLGQ